MMSGWAGKWRLVICDRLSGGRQLGVAKCRTADEIVERQVATYGHKHTITVAAADLLEQQPVVSFGAQCVASEGLRRRMADAHTDFAKPMKRRRKVAN